MKRNIPKQPMIEEYWVIRYGDLLSKIENELEWDLSSFRLEDTELKNMPAATTKMVVYTPKKYCTREKLVYKIDALLLYISMMAPKSEKAKIGFTYVDDV
jgi:hypothetical protein